MVMKRYLDDRNWLVEAALIIEKHEKIVPERRHLVALKGYYDGELQKIIRMMASLEKKLDSKIAETKR